MADLLHSGAIQQLEVALMGSPAVQVVDLLANRLTQTSNVAAQHQTTFPTITPPLLWFLFWGFHHQSCLHLLQPQNQLH